MRVVGAKLYGVFGAGFEVVLKEPLTVNEGELLRVQQVDGEWVVTVEQPEKSDRAG